jgi:hypothetical protein
MLDFLCFIWFFRAIIEACTWVFATLIWLAILPFKILGPKGSCILIAVLALMGLVFTFPYVFLTIGIAGLSLMLFLPRNKLPPKPRTRRRHRAAKNESEWRDSVGDTAETDGWDEAPSGTDMEASPNLDALLEKKLAEEERERMHKRERSTGALGEPVVGRVARSSGALGEPVGGRVARSSGALGEPVGGRVARSSGALGEPIGDRMARSAGALGEPVGHRVQYRKVWDEAPSATEAKVPLDLDALLDIKLAKEEKERARRKEVEGRKTASLEKLRARRRPA